MPADPLAEPPATGPDWALVLNGRMDDGGPRYVETPLDPLADGAPLVAEPWNTVTATFFVWIALYWLWRVRGRLRDFPFLVACMPVLLAGGIGGTLFHGTRAARFFFLLDVIPISLLGLAGGLFMASRLMGKRPPLARLLVLCGVLVFYAVVNRLFFAALGPMNRQLSINLSYASLASIVLIPVVLVLWKTRFRHGGWVVAGAVSFGIAWVARLVDQYSAEYLPMGTHWIWHTFGALTTAAMVTYFYRVEAEAAEQERRAAGARAGGAT